MSHRRPSQLPGRRGMRLSHSLSNCTQRSRSGRCWQDCCITQAMNDHAYDISYLLESDSELIKADVPDLRVRTSPVTRLPVVNLVQVQEALARELLGAAEAHEALIQQYLRISGDAFREAALQ